jgi:hypothetical protein
VRRLSKREVRLVIALAAVAVLALVGIAFTPPTPPNPEEAHAYYVTLFERAQVITITPAGGGDPVTVTRDNARALLHRLALGARYGAIAPSPSPVPPVYLLDVMLADGSTVKNVGVSYHLEAPDQPAAGKFWLFPGSPDRGPSDAPPQTPPLVEAIETYLSSVRGESPAPAEQRHE